MSRASFWIGDPSIISERQYLGCIGFNGNPEDEDLLELQIIKTPQEFIDFVTKVLVPRKDYSPPENGWPFSHFENTGYTYIFMDGKIEVVVEVEKMLEKYQDE